MSNWPELDPLAQRVLLVGWDAADWRVIRPLLAQGKMPHLARMMAEGVSGNMATLQPPLSPMLWTSIATGKRPYKHGIHGFTEPRPDGQGVQPITNLGRTAKAMWNILHQAGKTSNVIGWWPSHPAEPIRGVMVSNHFQQATAAPDQPWPMRPGLVHPPRLAKALAEFRVHPGELTDEDLGPFVPLGAKIDQTKDRRLRTLAKLIADVSSVHGAATALMQLEPWDFAAVYYDGIDHFSHAFMAYHPPRRPNVNEEDFEIYSGVVEAAYRFHDQMLGALLALAGSETTVILMSDHGFHPDGQRPLSIPVEPAGPAIEHRNFGIFVMRGPGVKRDAEINGLNVLDVCPTVLRLFGLPLGADMDGKVAVTAFERLPKVDHVPSWDAIAGDAGCHPPGRRVDGAEAAEALKQLAELGYIEAPAENAQEAVAEAVREQKFNLAQAYIDGGRAMDAVPLLQEVWARWPKEHRFGLLLLHALEILGRVAERRATLEKLGDNYREFAREAAEELQLLDERAQSAKADRGVAEKLLLNERAKRRKLAWLAADRTALLGSLWALQALLENDRPTATRWYEEVAAAELRSVGLLNTVGGGFLRLRQYSRAAEVFQRSLAIDYEDHVAWVGLARARAGLGQFEATAEAALSAVELVYQSPRAHQLLGFALLKSGKLDEAATALRVAVHQAPAFPAAHRLLGRVLELQGHRDEAMKHRALARQIRALKTLQVSPTGLAPDRISPEAAAVSPRPVRPRRPLPRGFAGRAVWVDVPADDMVTVVAGLPRTGTSMMMQMLVAGGLPPLTDGKRVADSDNPHGYLEFEPATRLREDQSWLPQAKGKVVKIVAQLLRHLPKGFHYRVVFMHRDLREVIASQQAMLTRLGRTGGQLAPERLSTVLEGQVEQVAAWLRRQPNIRVIHLDYASVTQDAAGTAARLREFLGDSLEVEKMMTAVRPELRRQRSS
jgi:predicted AlkP superfamily phosphohydrolase/phosphomutase/tetratricopeptide (TPR) repeat protein